MSIKILFLGNSAILQRRILPAIKLISGAEYEICSKRSHLDKKKKIFYNNYVDAIKSTNADIVYISLKNKDHFKYAKLSLMHNKHTIVDKPIVLNSRQLKILLKLSKAKKKLISEALVFNFHKQYKFLNKYLKKKNLNIIMQFNIPRGNKFNFFQKRINHESCLYDMMPYTVYMILQFLKKPMIKSVVKIKENKLNSDFSICCHSNKNNNLFFGNFSHNREYSNYIRISNAASSITLNRFCAPPPDQKMTILYRQLNKQKIIYTSKDNTFLRYIKKCIMLVKVNNYNFFHKELLNQINFRDKIIKYK
jgi:predicted dehydrogenase